MALGLFYTWLLYINSLNCRILVEAMANLNYRFQIVITLYPYIYIGISYKEGMSIWSMLHDGELIT